jgi:hypothetical protein
VREGSEKQSDESVHAVQGWRVCSWEGREVKAYAYAMDCFQKTVYGILEADGIDDAVAHLGDNVDIIEVDLPDEVVILADDNERARLAKKALEERLDGQDSDWWGW